MLDALQDGPVWVVPAVLGMAVTLKELCVKADAEQARKGAPVNQVRRWATAHKPGGSCKPGAVMGHGLPGSCKV